MWWVKKINDCRSRLIRWSWNKFHKRMIQIQGLLVELGEVQQSWGQNFEAIKEKS